MKQEIETSFEEACKSAVLQSRETGELKFVLVNQGGYYYIDNHYEKDFLFKVYPGGRKQLSSAGADIAWRLGILHKFE